MKAFMLIRRYLALGHQLAHLDPLNLKEIYGNRKEFGNVMVKGSIEESMPKYDNKILNKTFNIENG